MSGPKVGKDIGSRMFAVMNRDAHQVRLLFKSRESKSAEDEAYRQKKLAKKFLVKGRVVGSGRVEWDVFQLEGDSPPKVVGRGFAWQEEAIAFARDRSLGRVAVGFKGIRGLFRAGYGGIISADKTIELPGQKSVPIKQVKSGVLVG